MNLEEYFNRLQKRAKQQKDESDRTKADVSAHDDTLPIKRFLDEGKRDYN